MRQTLKKYEIIRKRKEIEQVLKKGGHRQTENLTLRYLPANRKRVAFLVAKDIKTAVMRNLIRRRLREIYRRNKESFTEGFEYVIQAHPNAVGKTYWQLQEELLSLAKGVKN
ncbi:MAG: ribonuclease P protein component [candidate division WOR-3 bacterium]